ncbi:MAG TPA: carbohydrate porin [Acetobacteraceae bacterium]|jgi:porin|nr:carbohydrate porin [Acetobacteraceae bacterium]
MPSRSKLARLAVIAAAVVVVPLAVARADDAAASDDQPKSFWEQDQMLGDLGGLRTLLDGAGVTFSLQEQSELIGNLTGGLRTGAVYDGATLGMVTVDMDKAVGIPGGKFYVSAYQIHGRSPTENLVGSLQTVTSIDATRATRLYNLYYEQLFFGDALSVRLGQFAADDEFILNTYGALFINSTFGFPALPAIDLPAGGPAYPLTTPGIRFRVRPTDALSLYAALFNGDPAPNGVGNPQILNNSGTTFRTNGGAFVISEAQYAINQGDKATGLPGTYKIGAWINTNKFADTRDDRTGESLASPTSGGVPLQHQNDWSIYATFDQLVWRREGTKDQGIGVFGRVMGAPSDRNASNFYANGGLNWKAPIASRPDDSAGLGFGYVAISPRVMAFDRDIAFFTGQPFPIANREVLFEATYQYQAAGWLQIQPDAQYIINPGGHVPNPVVPGQVIKNAFILGVRATVQF